MTRSLFSLSLLVICISCQSKEAGKDYRAVARVGEHVLYLKDIENLVPTGTSREDSVLMVRNFQNKWASKILLGEAARMNLNDSRKKGFDAMVEQYRDELYSRAYMEDVVKKSVDTTVTDVELKEYYDRNKANFKTSGLLLRLRYINVPANHDRLGLIREKFKSFRKSDQNFWKTYQPQFNHSALNDSTWVEMAEVYRHIPFITPENRNEYMISGRHFEVNNAGNQYMVHIRQVIEKNSVAPFEYLKPTLKQVIVNRRMMELIKQFEKDIINDAIKDDKYEIY